MTVIPMPSDASGPSVNFVSELSSALEENSFGFREYQIVQETQLESIATVALLEGHTITVSLSPRGFKVGSLIVDICLKLISARNGQNQVSNEETEVIHETLEQLLDSQSPAYRLASQQALFSRLDEHANALTNKGDDLADSAAYDERDTR